MIKVFVLMDDASRITAVDAEWNIADTSAWTQVDTGEGDCFLHAQSSYLPKSILAEHGIPRYKLANGVPVERTQAEIDADAALLPAAPKSDAERIAEMEAVIDALIGGETA